MPGPTSDLRPTNEIVFDEPPRRAGVEFSSSDGFAPGRRWQAIAVSIALVAAAASALVLRSPDRADAVVFRYAAAVGETRTYDVSMDMDMRAVGLPDAESVTGSLRASMTWTVTETRPDGSMVVDVTVTVVESSLPDSDFPATGGTMTVVVAADGRVLEVRGSNGLFTMPGMSGPLPGAEGENPADPGTSQFFFPRFPADAIAPGDDWSETNEVPLPFASGESMVITTSGSHEGFEDTAYGRAARISQRVQVPMDIEFPLGEFFQAFFEGFAQGFSGLGNTGPSPTVPPELAAAKMIFRGDMDMDADALVIPSTSDLVEMTGDMRMRMEVELENFPPELAAAGGPEEFSMDGTMRMTIIRVS